MLLLDFGSIRSGTPTDVFGHATSVPAAFIAATATAQSLPLAWRRRAPLAVFWIVLAVCLLQVSVRLALRSDLSLMIALYGVARYAPPRRPHLLLAAAGAQRLLATPRGRCSLMPAGGSSWPGAVPRRRSRAAPVRARHGGCGYHRGARPHRQDLLPMVVGYVLVMSALAAGLLMLRRTGATATPGASREPGMAVSPGGTGAAAPGRRGWLRLIRHLVTASVGGYLTLMAFVIAYHYAVMRVGGNFIESAFTGCALLLGLSCPVFLAASWLTERWLRHKATRGPHPRRVRIGRRHA